MLSPPFIDTGYIALYFFVIPIWPFYYGYVTLHYLCLEAKMEVFDPQDSVVSSSRI